VLASEARSQQVGIADSGSGGADYLQTAGEPTPYRPDTEEYGTGTGSTEYCPFYAQYLSDLPDDGDPAEAVPFDFTDQGLIDTEELVGLAAGHGTCPHSIMGAILGHMEVVIGNYYHAFDPTTAGQFTGALIDDSTFVVCDEAHMLEPRVRDLVSDGVGDRTLRDAVSELTRVVQAVEFDDGATPSTGNGDSPAQAGGEDDADLVRGELQESDVKLDELRNLRDFCESLRTELDRRVKAHLDSERPGWRAELNDLDDYELPLRDPETPAIDEITEWADREGFGEGVWARAEAVAAVVARILNELEDEDASRAVTPVGRVLNAWYRRDHESFFREIELERTWDETERPDSWRRAYNARLALYNCVPSEAIGDRLAAFGGGVLMSATLEPLDVFREVTGLNHLENDGRPISTRSYGLGFPEEKRASFAVDAPKFTYSNRGTLREENECRRMHVDAAATVARSPGNALVGMPSYGEAEWMAEKLESRLDKPVLLDSSSTDEVTEDLKAEFFRGEPKALVTSIRGTLTEGVDYRGDRLSAAVVCGVPIINTASPRTRAVRTAYDREFGDVPASDASGSKRGGTSRSGFETALTVPAVRKARQAIGRVIRSPEEVGVRALVDARYARASWNSVREYLPEQEREEFQPVSPDMLELGVNRFWEQHP